MDGGGRHKESNLLDHVRPEFFMKVGGWVWASDWRLAGPDVRLLLYENCRSLEMTVVQSGVSIRYSNGHIPISEMG